MLNNLFFGYLPLKWKRLARVLSFLISPLTGIFFLALDLSCCDPLENFIIGLGAHIVLVIIISYTIKPFVVKD
jgi:hypothetical protein